MENWDWIGSSNLAGKIMAGWVAVKNYYTELHRGKKYYTEELLFCNQDFSCKSH
jgi:hypothetical protein